MLKFQSEEDTEREEGEEKREKRKTQFRHLEKTNQKSRNLYLCFLFKQFKILKLPSKSRQ